MDEKKSRILELLIGVIIIITGFFVWWWSQQLVWIQIFPPPFAKMIIEIIPIIFWGLGIMFILDALRRLRKI